jgi:drug/metabolite transporter (DMT)-like permease
MSESCHNITPRSSFRGYALGCIASCAYGLNPLFAKPLYALGLDVSSVLFYRYTLASIILAIIIAIRHDSFKIPRKSLIPMISCGILFAASSITLFASYQYMDVGIASTILYITPVFVAIFMAIFYHEPLTITNVITILVALIGIAMLSINGDASFHSPIGILLVAISAITYGIYMIIVNKSSLKDMGTLPLTFYSILIGIAVFAVNLNFFRDLVILPTVPLGYICVIGLALFPTIISIGAMNVAIMHIGPVKTSMLGALEPVTAIIVGVTVFHEQLTLINTLGIIIVLLAVTFLVAGRYILPSKSHK